MSNPRRPLCSPIGIAILGLGWLLGVVPPASPEEPPVFAIVNARIIPVSGPPVEKGTVIIRNGVIEAVGAAVAVPGDARVIEAGGLTVYPGLIDALSDIGLEETRTQATAEARGAEPSPGTPQQQPPQPTLSSDERQGLTPYRDAADLLNGSHRKIESARAVGITTTLLAPAGGSSWAAAAW